MSGHLERYTERAYCAHGGPPAPESVGAVLRDTWECDECTANWTLILTRFDTLAWLPSPIYTRRRGWLDRRRRRIQQARPAAARGRT